MPRRWPAARDPDFVSVLSDRVWYLTQSGRDMWCRPPHGFFFTSSDAATAFAAAIGTELELAPIAIASKELVSTEGIAAMRDLDVTRIFVDPTLRPRHRRRVRHDPPHRRRPPTVV